MKMKSVCFSFFPFFFSLFLGNGIWELRCVMFGSFRDTEEISSIFLMFCNWVLVVSVFDSSTFLFLFYYYYYYYYYFAFFSCC